MELLFSIIIGVSVVLLTLIVIRSKSLIEKFQLRCEEYVKNLSIEKLLETSEFKKKIKSYIHDELTNNTKPKEEDEFSLNRFQAKYQKIIDESIPRERRTDEFSLYKQIYLPFVNIEKFKSFNYFFISKLIQYYKLNQTTLIMPNPIADSKKEFRRFIIAPNSWRQFPAYCMEDKPSEGGYRILINKNYDIEIYCMTQKCTPEQQKRFTKIYKIDFNKYERKMLSNIYTEMRLFIIDCMEKYKNSNY